MKFLIQIDHQGNILPEANFLLEQLKKIYNDSNDPFTLIYAMTDDFMSFGSYSMMLRKCMSDPIKLKQIIPVGDLKFIQEFIRLLWGSQCGVNFIKPLNVPQELMLMLYSGREIHNITFNEIQEADEVSAELIKILENQRKLYGRWYVKNMYCIHHRDNGFYDVIKDTNNGFKTCECRMGEDGKSVHKVFDHEFGKKIIGTQISKLIPNIVSEWRVFINKKDISRNPVIGIENTKGNPLMFPKKDRILQFIEQYTQSPTVYTMDVMVDVNGNTWILNCNYLFLSKLHGFGNVRYPMMLQIAWNDMIKSLEQKFEYLKEHGYDPQPGYMEDEKP